MASRICLMLKSGITNSFPIVSTIPRFFFDANAVFKASTRSTFSDVSTASLFLLTGSNGESSPMLDRLVVLVTLPGLSPGDTEDELAEESARPIRCRETLFGNAVVAMVESRWSRRINRSQGMCMQWRGSEYAVPKMLAT